MTRFAIAIGSNIGDRIQHLRDGVEGLEESGNIVATSGLYETAPVGGPIQDPYLNAVVLLDCDLEASALLAALHVIEDRQGRERTERWGPRTLDLDIVVSDGPAIYDPPHLVIPHPSARERRFVLAPLCDVWPDALVDADTSARHALSAVADQDVDPLGAHWNRVGLRPPGTYWVIGQLFLFALLAVTLVQGGSLPDSFNDPLAIVGVALVGAGVILGGAASASLGSALTPMPEPLAGADLVAAGPYRWVRHPIYGGVILVALGASVFLSSPIGVGLALAILAFFTMKARYEERQLRIAYPGYRDYTHRVKKRFLPFVV